MVSSESLTAIAALILVISSRRLGASHPPPTSSHSSYISPHLESLAPPPPPPPWKRLPLDPPWSLRGSAAVAPTTTFRSSASSSRPYLLFTSAFQTDSPLLNHRESNYEDNVKYDDVSNETVNRSPPWEQQQHHHQRRQDETNRNLSSPRRQQSWI